jgi:putative GTP pyrophosphokinase
MIDKETQQRILAEYDEKADTYRDLVERLQLLLKQILEFHKIEVHSITGRQKSRKSLAGKINKDDANYNTIGDLHDIAALRITTYFSDAVEAVVDILAGELNIISSGNKRDQLESNSFGYLSWHQIAIFKDDRAGLVEYKPFKNIKFEIQTRSILQHTWAEIEHDLGYKSAIELPPKYKRRLALVAGQLEAVDEEFTRIRTDLEEYKSKLPADIERSPDDVLLTYDAAFLFIDSPLVQEIDEEILRQTDKIGNIRGPKMGGAALASIVYSFSNVGITTVGDLSKALTINRSHIVSLAQKLKNKRIFEAEGYNGGPGTTFRYLWIIAESIRNEVGYNLFLNDIYSASEAEEHASLTAEIVEARSLLMGK